MCVCLSRQSTIRDSPNTFYSSSQSGLFMIININISKLQKNFQLNPRKFQKVIFYP